MSIHPTTTTQEIIYVCDAIKQLVQHHKEWALDYEYNSKTNEFCHKNAIQLVKEMVQNWFSI